MHPFNTFPDLLTYGFFSPFILRVVLGYIFINLGYLKLSKETERWKLFFESIHLKPVKIFTYISALIEIIGGIMLILGFYTQITALAFAIITFGELYVEFKVDTLLKRNLVFYLLIFAISVSLLLTGAGFMAMDLPL